MTWAWARAANWGRCLWAMSVRAISRLRNIFQDPDRRFDATMVIVAALLIAITLLVLLLKGTCQDPLVLVNFVGVMLLVLSIPISLIGARRKWQWPVFLAVCGLLLWGMSLVLGPKAWSEFPGFFLRLFHPVC